MSVDSHSKQGGLQGHPLPLRAVHRLHHGQQVLQDGTRDGQPQYYVRYY